MNDEVLIKDFERQLKELYNNRLKFFITFLVHKDGDIYTVETYNCWGIIHDMGQDKFNNWRKVAEQALINIRELYPGKEIRL